MADMNDMDLIYGWQAEPGVREFSRNPTIPSYPEHQQWFIKTLADRQCFFWIAEHVNASVGFIRMNVMANDPDMMEVSIVTSPAFQHCGIGAWMLEAIKDKYSHYTIMAEVSSANEASMKLFRSVGFVEREPGVFFWRADNSEQNIWQKGISPP